MPPPQQLRQQTSNCSSLLIYRPRKDERLSWLTYSGWLTHKWSPISYKSSAGQRKHIGQRPMLYRWITQPTRIEGALLVTTKISELWPSGAKTANGVKKFVTPFWYTVWLDSEGHRCIAGLKLGAVTLKCGALEEHLLKQFWWTLVHFSGNTNF